jgi:hypothetical protein
MTHVIMFMTGPVRTGLFSFPILQCFSCASYHDEMILASLSEVIAEIGFPWLVLLRPKQGVWAKYWRNIGQNIVRPVS